MTAALHVWTHALFIFFLIKRIFVFINIFSFAPAGKAERQILVGGGFIDSSSVG